MIPSPYQRYGLVNVTHQHHNHESIVVMPRGSVGARNRGPHHQVDDWLELRGRARIFFSWPPRGINFPLVN